MGKKSKKERKSLSPFGAVSKSGMSFREELISKLKGSSFRQLNEDLFYATDSNNSFNEIKKNPKLFKEYHEGFMSQVISRWPENPSEIIESYLRLKFSMLSDDVLKDIVVADFGCGEAKLAQNLVKSFPSLRKGFNSFDLFKSNKFVTVCNINETPLADSSVDIGVFCLSLMGKDFWSFLLEAKRVVKENGELIVAEVSSRFMPIDVNDPDEKKEKVDKAITMKTGIESFKRGMQMLGFVEKKKSKTNKMKLLIDKPITPVTPDIFKIFYFTKSITTPSGNDDELLKKLSNTFQFKPYKYKKR